MRWLKYAMLMVALATLTSCTQAEGETEIVFFSIGKADAILLTNGEHAVLIDAGEDEDGEEILRYLQKKGVKALDLMIITHFDKDHVGGADWLLDQIPIGAVYDAAYEADSKQYRQYVGALETNNVPRYRVSKPLEIEVGALTFTVLPTALATKEDNDNSLVLSVADGMHSFLFMGDAEEARIDELLSQGLAAHNVIKMPHHGRYKHNLGELLQMVSPSVAILMDSDKNPSENETLALLDSMGVQRYQTKNGNVMLISSSKGIALGQ